MNSAHDLGGQHGFGPVVPEPDEAVFHAPWEARVLALTVAMGATGSWTIDTSRHARESLPPAEYLASSYYQIWRAGLERLLQLRQLATAEEIASGAVIEPPAPVKRVLQAADVTPVLHRGTDYRREPPAPAQFRVGDVVRARKIHPRGHTRLPRYARGNVGTIARIHGCHVFPDTAAHGGGDHPHWLYAVRFAAVELWGEAADPTVSVLIDCWEPYLALP